MQPKESVFPLTEKDSEWCKSLSKREFYAALAMQAMIAAQVVSVGRTPQAAKAAFAYADAMIKESEKKV